MERPMTPAPHWLEWITLAATAVAGFGSAPAWIILPAALALGLESVWGKPHQLRRHPRVPLSTKMRAYLVSGAVFALLGALLAFLLGRALAALF